MFSAQTGMTGKLAITRVPRIDRIVIGFLPPEYYDLVEV
jgi:hypothetical protein